MQSITVLPHECGVPFEVLDRPLHSSDVLRGGYVRVVVTNSKEELFRSAPDAGSVMWLVARKTLTVSDLHNLVQKRRGWNGTLQYATDSSLSTWKQTPVKVATLSALKSPPKSRRNKSQRIVGTLHFEIQGRIDARNVHHIGIVLPHCPHISRGEECKVFEGLVNYEFDATALSHMEQYSHSSIPLRGCRYGVDCRAYQRLQHLHGDDARVNDSCHMKVYSHLCCATQMPIATVSPFKLCSLSSFEERIDGVSQANACIDAVEAFATRKISAKGPLTALINEVIKNRFGADLTVDASSGVSLRTIAEETLKHERHVAMGSPLKIHHMLALLLYTGCHCQTDLTHSQRNGDYLKWAVWDKLLREALRRMEKVTVRMAPVYSGVKDVELKGNVRFGVFRTFVSASLNPIAAMNFRAERGMLLGFEVPRVRPGASERKPTDTRGVDVSWISKFSSEMEVLFSRESGYFCLKQESKTGTTQRVRVAFSGVISGSRLF